MTSLKDLKAKSASNLKKLKEKTKEQSSFSNSKDERLWDIQRGKDGNAFAVIRFLPVSKIDETNDPEKAMPWIKVYTHAFQHPDTGRWYIEKSLSTLNQPDPVFEENRKLYALKTEEGKAIATRQKRKLSYYSNILVVSDKNNPDNEGKVFLYRYGQKIHDKLKAIIDPEEAFGEQPGDPMNFWAGRDFRLKIKTVGDWPNYDESSFTDEKVISDKNGKEYSDDEIEAIWDKSYSLLDFHDPKEFKTYDELKTRFDFVLGKDDGGSTSKPRRDADQERSEPAKELKSTSAPKQSTASAPKESEDDEVDLDTLLEGLDD